jgi:hypothetical protein
MSGQVDSARARAQRYREFAFDAERRAAATQFADLGAMFRNVAREWRMLASEAERSAGVGIASSHHRIAA